MKSLLDLIKALYGPKALSSTLGTRTNVVRLPTGKLQRYLTEPLNIEAASDKAAVNAYNEMQQLIPDVPKMNDGEKLIFEGNLRRLKNKLEASDLLPKQKVTKEGEVIGMESKEKITGEELKKLTEEKGTVNPPTTVSGQLELQGKKLENLGKKIDEEFIAGKKKKTAGEILDEYFSSYKSMKEVEDQALVRAVAREIMYQDLKAGKLKVPKEVEDIIRGIGPANKDVLDEFNQWYGFSAIEDLHDNADRFYRMTSPKEAVDFLKQNKYSNWEKVYQPREKPIKEYMTPGEFQDMLKDATVNKYGVISPKASESLDKETAKEIYDFYLKSGDRNLIIKEINEISEGKKFDVYKVEDRNRIIDILTDVLKKLGPPVATGTVGLDYLAEKAVPPKTEGGTQQSLGLDYLMGTEPPKEGYAGGGRINFQVGGLGAIAKFRKFLKQYNYKEKPNQFYQFGKEPKEDIRHIAEDMADKAFKKPLEELPDNIKYKLLDAANEEYINTLTLSADTFSTGGRVGFKSGSGGKKILDLINKVNKELKAKKSMETVDVKTGEVGPAKEPVMTAESKSRKLTKDEIADYEEAIGRDSEQWMSEGTVDEAEKALKRSKDEEAYYRGQYKAGKLDPAPGEQTEARMKFLQKKFDEVLATGERKHITLEEAQELQELQFAFRRKAKESEQALENEMNRVLNQYDKSMFIKDAQGRVDVTNPANAEKMALLLKRDHPEIYNKIFKLAEDINQKQTLDEFDITGRKPNAKGGLNYLMGL